MIDKFEIRDALGTDAPALEDLYVQAFPDEDLLPVLRDLQSAPAAAFVGIVDGTLVSHVAFTTCGIADRTEQVALLGPLAVAPSLQRQGLGSALVNAGLRHAREAGMAAVYVLGDPGYYGRFGFAPDADVAPPYKLPDEWRGAWQSLSLADTKTPPRGQLIVPAAWRREALWLP